jgi:lipopolysaccharide/colanic/teichoic acid biosynthesis glycosyltransferase
MYKNADEIKAELLSRNEMVGPVFKLANDPRVTPLGRILRKYSLDELPQLWSVIKGDMSLVGPRPPLQTEYVHFTDWQKQKLEIRPGMTCLWQVSGRNNIADFDEWVKLDLEYIQKRNFWYDIKMMADTGRCVIRGTGK